MDNLIKDTATLELFCWLPPDSDLPAWDMLKGSPFGATLSAPEGGPPSLGNQYSTLQNYFAEYHLEYFRQRRFDYFPSRLHALHLFATHTDALTFAQKHPRQVLGRQLLKPRTTGPYVCSFHDASWLEYLRLPHNLSLTTLDQVAEFYWAGRTVEETGLPFLDQPWREPPVIEALFQGQLVSTITSAQSGWLPGFC